MTKPSDLIAELKRLGEAATPGPWETETINADFYEPDRITSRGISQKDGKGLNQGEDYEMFSVDDCDLIIALRNALPQILALLEAGEGLVKTARDARNALSSLPIDALGETDDGIHSWPIRDEMTAHLDAKIDAYDNAAASGETGDGDGKA